MENNVMYTGSKEANSREIRYQWIIGTILIVTAFIGGMLFQSERLNEKVVTNTVEIRILKEGLTRIELVLKELSQNQ